eukprot:2002735-Rhodomonas_salina.1
MVVVRAGVDFRRGDAARAGLDFRRFVLTFGVILTFGVMILTFGAMTLTFGAMKLTFGAMTLTFRADFGGGPGGVDQQRAGSGHSSAGDGVPEEPPVPDILHGVREHRRHAVPPP